MRILFVDDEPHVLEALRRQSRVGGVEARFACGAEQALAMIAGEPFDAVVSDMRMPGMDGAELLERVRAMRPGMVRVALSGDAASALRQRGEAVAHAWLSKPCSFQVIRDTLATLRPGEG
jgi:CheY-like chemotaxis protein